MKKSFVDILKQKQKALFIIASAIRKFYIVNYKNYARRILFSLALLVFCSCRC